MKNININQEKTYNVNETIDHSNNRDKPRPIALNRAARRHLKKHPKDKNWMQENYFDFIHKYNIGMVPTKYQHLNGDLK